MLRTTLDWWHSYQKIITIIYYQDCEPMTREIDDFASIEDWMRNIFGLNRLQLIIDMTHIQY